MTRLALMTAALLLPAQAYAQSGHQGHDMPAEPVKAEPAQETHAGHNMDSMYQKAAPPEKVQSEPDPHTGHYMFAMPRDDSGESEVGDASAPASPSDHAADAVFGAEVMARSRKELAYEVGGMGYSLVMLDLAEVGFQKGRESYRFEGEAFTGGNINRFGLKFEGEGAFGEKIDDLELQALYSRAIAPYWNLQVGARYNIKPDPSRTYAVLGVEGITPYWFKVNAATFLSNKGEVRARLEGSYDLRLTQELILQPRIETNLSFQDIPAIGIGSGVTDFEAGLRLRYEIVQEIAPYIGVEGRKQFGDTARFTRAAGDDPSSVSFVAGIRIWF
jgi:copper resistance protein B